MLSSVSPAIKDGDRAIKYLPNPTDPDLLQGQDREDAKARYKAYKDRAEYDGFPARTLSGYMGALSSTPPDLEGIPSEIDYLIENSDGNGLALTESIEITQANLLEVKYHGLMSDFKGITDDRQMTNIAS